MACCTACAQSPSTSPCSRNRVRVRTHPRRVAGGVTVVGEHARNLSGTYPGRARAFEGINHNEKMFGSVQPGLVEIALSGVQGISTPVPGYEFSMVPRDFAERTLEKAQNVLAHFVAQRKVPRGAKFWMESHRAKLRDLYSKARRVYEGGVPKMTLKDYHALDDYLRVPRRG